MSNALKSAPRPRTMGRPKSADPMERLVHVRLSGEMSVKLDAIREKRLDRPAMSTMIREALAQYIRREEGA